MTLDQFKFLNEEKMEDAIWDGIFREVRMDGDLRVPLFKLGEF